MEKQSNNGHQELGSPMPKTLTETEFGTMVRRDLETAISFLLAVRNDDATGKTLVEYLYGRYLNQLHKAELDKQLKVQD